MDTYGTGIFLTFWGSKLFDMFLFQVSAESASQFGELIADPVTKELLHYTEKPETFVRPLIDLIISWHLFL